MYNIGYSNTELISDKQNHGEVGKEGCCSDGPKERKEGQVARTP